MAQRVLCNFEGSEEGKADNPPDGKRSRLGMGSHGEQWPTPCHVAVHQGGSGKTSQEWPQESPSMAAPLAHRCPDWPKTPCVLNMVENQPAKPPTRVGPAGNQAGTRQLHGPQCGTPPEWGPVTLSFLGPRKWSPRNDSLNFLPSNWDRRLE